MTDRKTLNVLMIGGDQTSNGGIGSVIKIFDYELKRNSKNINFWFLKTCYYIDRSKIFEIIIFINSIIKAINILLFNRIDIVHIHSSCGPSFFRKTFFLLLSKIFFKKTIIHIHSSRFYTFFLSKIFLLKSIIYFVLKLPNIVLVLCHDWENKLKDAYPNIRVKTLHNPVIISPINNQYIVSEQSLFKVLFLGILRKSKGIFDLLDTAKLFHVNGISDVQFIIGGKGELESYILDYIKQYGLIDIIYYVGWVSGQRKRNLFKNASLFFLPSYNEGMPISILEAMSYSLPILSTKVAGIPDLVKNGENGYLFNPGQINCFYNTIIELKSNKVLLDKFSNNSFHKSKLFSSNIIFQQLCNIYKDIV